MTRIKVPANKERAYPDQDVRVSSPASRRFTSSLRGMKDENDRRTEARVQPKIAAILGQREEPDTPAIAKARQEAEEARREADYARSRVGS
jgi:hypothetical protein